LKEYNKLSINPLASAKILGFQAEFEQKLKYYDTLVFAFFFRSLSLPFSLSIPICVSTRNYPAADKCYNDSIDILNDIMKESTETQKLIVQYQLSVCFLGKAKNSIQQHLISHHQSPTSTSVASSVPPSKEAVSNNVIENITYSIDILEKLSLFLKVFSEEASSPSSADDISFSSSSPASGFTKDYIYKQLQLPAKVSFSQEIITSDHPLQLSAILLSLLSSYELFSDFLRSHCRYYYDCYLVLVRNIQFIHFIQFSVKRIEEKFDASPQRKKQPVIDVSFV
jgi:hypothetical protein